MNVQCECGSQWFRLEGGDVDTPAGRARTMGTVAVDVSGRITAYSGILRCHECGAEHPAPFQRGLRAVPDVPFVRLGGADDDDEYDYIDPYGDT